MNEIDPRALFRLSVLGPLVSRERLERGELQQIIRELAQREYAIPGTRRRHIGEKTIQAWYYTWRSQGIDGLTPKVRVDRGQSKLSAANPGGHCWRPSARIRAARSARSGACSKPPAWWRTAALSRSTVHRLLQQHGLSRVSGSASEVEERRSFVAESPRARSGTAT